MTPEGDAALKKFAEDCMKFGVEPGNERALPMRLPASQRDRSSPQGEFVPLHSLDAEYHIVRDLFSGGASKADSELRVASVRGVLRFWWRAAAWGRFAADGGFTALRKREVDLFGSSERGCGALRFSISAANVDAATALSGQSAPWERYSTYGLDGRKRIASSGVRPSTFTFRIQSFDATALSDESLSAALKLLGLCGGIGAKSRNGWGSLTLGSLRSASVRVAEWACPTDEVALRAMLSTVLGTRTPSAPFTAVSERSAFGIGAKASDAMSAHRLLVTAYKEFVSGEDFQRRFVGQKIAGEGRAQFGLPRQNMASMPAELKTKRQAKPLFLHVHRASADSFFPVVTTLPGPFLRVDGSLPNDGLDLDAFARTVSARP